MADRLKGHSLLASRLIIAGVPVTGYGEDGGVDITPNSDLAEFTIGADGEMVIELTGDESYTMTVKVLPTSRAAFFLDLAMETQYTAAKVGIILPQPIQFTNLNTLRGISSDRSFFLRRPDESHNKKIASIEYTLVIPNPIRTPRAGNLP